MWGLKINALSKFSSLIAKHAQRLVREEPGATAIEYAMVAAGIAAVIAAAVNGLGLTTKGLYELIVSVGK